MRHVFPALAIPAFLACGFPVAARSQQAPPALPQYDNVAQVSLGQPAALLTGSWKFQIGDSPIDPATGALLWAEPDFSEASWGNFDLTPPQGSYDPINGSSGFVPGWTAHAYPGVTGYAWYRRRINISNTANGTLLALKMPQDVDDAYQVYINGRLIGEFGRFGARHVTFYNAQPRAFPLPDDIGDGPAVISVRMWMSPDTPFTGQDVGGLHGPPLLGEAPAIDAMLRLDWDGINRSEIGNFLQAAFLLLAAIMGFALYRIDRSEPAYLWLGAACTCTFLSRAFVLTGYYSAWLPMQVEVFSLDVLIQPLGFGLWVIFWGYWFGLDDMRRVRQIAFSLVALSALGTSMLRSPFYGNIVPVSASSWLMPLTVMLKLLLGLLILWVTYRGIRRSRTDGWLALPAVLLMILWIYQEELSVVHIPTIFRLGGIVVGISSFAALLTLGIIFVLLTRRFLQSLRERERWRAEVESARAVQQVLIPAEIPPVPGFVISSVYKPASQVGGDFFQILPIRNNGVLVAIGDVSGKGMPAAMTVSLLVGTIRTLAHYTQSPGEILTAMNYRMLARSHGGFTTCLVLRIESSGAVTVANAGHVFPYVQGKELTVDNGLPLGLAGNSVYNETSFSLASKSQLTLVTDGVVEARDKTGALFGFERAAKISTQGADAIAQTAQEFGQDDDITVLTIVRLGASELSSSKLNMPALKPSLA